MNRKIKGADKHGKKEKFQYLSWILNTSQLIKNVIKIYLTLFSKVQPMDLYNCMSWGAVIC